MLYEIVTNFPDKILDTNNPPCISLYQPTHRHRPENKQDLIVFKNLVRKIENSLKLKYPSRKIQPLLEPFRVLAEDRPFWEHALDGLALLANEDRCVVYRLQRPVKEVAIVADTFHIKPLIRVFQSADRYHLLGLNRETFNLYEGNRYGFEEISLPPDVPRTAREVIGEEEYERQISLAPHSRFSGAPIFYGHTEKNEEIDKNTEKFFRFVDKFVLDNFSRPSGLPLMLVALPEYHGLFHKLSRNPFLMKEGLKVAHSPDTTPQLKEAVWEILEPTYLEKTRVLVEKYEEARAKWLATDDLSQIARAALQNNVKHLMIEADRQIPLTINPNTMELEESDLDNPEHDDLLDDLAELVFRSKGEVVVLPKERMPSDTGAAAIFRFLSVV